MRANVERGQLSIDGTEPVAFPLSKPLEGLTPGKHAVTLTAEGYAPGYQETRVEPDRLGEMQLTLSELPRPWYRKWWTWALITTGVATGVTATILLLPSEPTNGEVVMTIK